MRKAREAIVEVQDAWVAVTAKDALDAPYPGLLDGPGPGAPGFAGSSTILSQPRRGSFARSLDRLTCKYQLFFEEAINGPWV